MALIPFDDRDGFIWMDGEMLPWREARIHVITHGLHYGSSVFEGERAYNGHIFKSLQHTQRLVKSAEILGMNMPYTVEQLEEAKHAVLAKSGFSNAYVRPVAWRGSEQMGISAQATKTHVAIACWDWPSYFPVELRENGITLRTAEWKRPAPDTAPTQAKAAGLYMICTASKHSAENAGYHDALMLDYRGYVAEATGANLFMVKNGEIHTPTPDCFLNGITRQTVIELAEQLGYKLHVRHITPDELKQADEVFVTGTAAEVTAIGKIDETTYKVGPVTRALRDAYETLVRTPPAATQAA
jgi:branched-chain amino acid aminotransferase